MRSINSVVLSSAIHAGVAVLPANGNRVAVYLWAPSASYAEYMFGTSNEFNAAFGIPTGGAGLWLTREMIGDHIEHAIFVTNAVAAIVGCTEVTES